MPPFQPDGSFLRVNTDFQAINGSLWQQDLSASIKVIASRHDLHDEDLGDGIAACLNLDGLNTMRANLAMGGYRISGAAAAVSLGDMARYGQCAGSMDFDADVLTLSDRDGAVIDTVSIPTGGGGTGTVTAVGTGDGLFGGTITTVGTIALEVLSTGQTYSGGIAGVVIDKHGRVTQVTTGGFANTNLSNTPGALNVTMSSSTGTGTVLAAATSLLAGVLSADDKKKIDAIQEISSGQFTPEFVNASNINSGDIFWSRVGDMVTMHGRVRWSSLTLPDPSSLMFNGLPYDIYNDSDQLGAGTVARCTNVDWGGQSNLDYTFMGLEGIANTDRVALYLNFSLGSNASAGQSLGMIYDQLGASGYFDINFIYRTAQDINSPNP